MINKKYPLTKSKNWLAIDISNELRILLHSKKFTENEFEHIALDEALNKIEAIREKKKRIEVLTEIRDYYQKELQRKEKKLRDKIEYDTALKDRLKSDKSGGMLRYGWYNDLK